MDNERLSRARAAMAAAGIDALVCRLPENVLLLSGHWPLNGLSFLLFPRYGSPLIIVPHCDEIEARDELWEAECRTFVHGVLTAGDAYAEIGSHLKAASAGKRWTRVGIEASFESVAPPWNAAEIAIPASATRAMLERAFGADALVDATALLMDLRSRKTPGEVAKLRAANEIAAFGLAAFTENVDIGVTGVELAAAVESEVMVRGTGYKGTRRARAFAQVATGRQETSVAYRPMEISTNRKLGNGETALLELAVVADGFWADRTRPRVAGVASSRTRELFDVVLRAQDAAIRTVAPGASTGEVDRAARSVINDAGFTAKEFLHVTGHSLGLRYHEPVPLIVPGGTTELEEGMVHTVEPGVYIAGTGGMRIEDNVAVTADGAEVLGPAPRALDG